MSFTKGPWRAVHSSWENSLVMSGEDWIATVSIDSDVTEDTQDELEGIKEKNAELMAAAPDLLEALKNLVDACDGNYAELTSECQRIIAKAEGK